jgi:hypothetical protein
MPGKYPGHNKAPLIVRVTRGHLSGEEYDRHFYGLISAAVIANVPDDTLNTIEVSKCVLLVMATPPSSLRYSPDAIKKFITLGANQCLTDSGSMVRVESAVVNKHYPKQVIVRVRFRKFSLTDLM